MISQNITRQCVKMNREQINGIINPTNKYLISMLLGLGYGCQIWICVRQGYCSIFVSFSIYLKDRTIIHMSEYVSDTGTSGKMKSPSNIGYMYVYALKLLFFSFKSHHIQDLENLSLHPSLMTNFP